MTRLGLVVAGCGVTLLWLAALYLYPLRWRDPHGEGQLAALVLTSGLHAALALPLAVAWWAGAVRPRFALLVAAAPLAHLLGSRVEGPVGEVYFVVPSVAILVAGALESWRGLIVLLILTSFVGVIALADWVMPSAHLQGTYPPNPALQQTAGSLALFGGTSAPVVTSCPGGC